MNGTFAYSVEIEHDNCTSSYFPLSEGDIEVSFSIMNDWNIETRGLLELNIEEHLLTIL